MRGERVMCVCRKETEGERRKTAGGRKNRERKSIQEKKVVGEARGPGAWWQDTAGRRHGIYI